MNECLHHTLCEINTLPPKKRYSQTRATQTLCSIAFPRSPAVVNRLCDGHVQLQAWFQCHNVLRYSSRFHSGKADHMHEPNHKSHLLMQGRHSGLARGMPPVFALKTAASLQYHPGATRAFRDCLRLGEPSLQRFLEHKNVVAMYWAYVRCLDPDSGALLEMAAHDLALHVEGGPEDGGEDGTASIMQTMRSHGGRRRSGKWGLRSASQMSSGVAELGPWGVKLQMCIAMEHCDLGAALPCPCSTPAYDEVAAWAALKHLILKRIL